MLKLEIPRFCEIEVEKDGYTNEYYIKSANRKMVILQNTFLNEVILIVDADEKHTYRNGKITLANSFIRRYFDIDKQNEEQSSYSVDYLKSLFGMK